MNRLIAVSLLIAFAAIFGCSGSSNSSQDINIGRQARQPFVRTADLVLTAHADRTDNGQVVISGTTNLPNNLKMWVNVEVGRLPKGAPKVVAGDEDVFVRDGKFNTVPLWLEVPNTRFTKKGWPKSVNVNVRDVPFPAGQYKVHFEAFFNGAWQTNEVIAALGGEDGKNLKGKILRATDTDVTDSPKTLDYKQMIAFPALTPEARAIALVRAAILTVPGSGRSAGDVQANLDLYLLAPDMRQGKEWSARAKTPTAYEVSYDFIDGSDGEQQAIWTANLTSGEVRYVNKYAKTFSWTPNY